MDLAEREFVQVGRLDEREITTSLGKRLLMILSPFGGSRWILLATDREPRIVLILISLPPNNAVQPNARVASRE